MLFNGFQYKRNDFSGGMKMAYNKDFGVDLGSENTFICKKNKGIIVNETSVIAVDSVSDRVIAIGREAKQMIGRVPSTIEVEYTIQDGVISSFEKTGLLLSEFIKAHNVGFGKTRMILSIPCCSTAVERKAVEDVARTCGAKETYVIEEPLAAALGSGIVIFAPNGRMVVDMGAGTTEIAVLSLGSVVSYHYIPSAGKQLNTNIINYVRRVHNVLIGEPTAEALKIKLGTVEDNGENEFMMVSGRELSKGLPVNIEVTSEHIREAIYPGVQSIIEGISYTLEHIDPELSADIISNGILLTGGTSMMPGWAPLIENAIGVKAELSTIPLECVAAGCANAFDVLEELKKHNAII